MSNMPNPLVVNEHVVTMLDNKVVKCMIVEITTRRVKLGRNEVVVQTFIGLTTNEYNQYRVEDPEFVKNVNDVYRNKQQLLDSL